MRKTLKILTILLFCSTSIFGQKISSTDSLEVVQTSKALFAAIESDNMETLTSLSTDKIYCIICPDSTDFLDSPYMLDKKGFLQNHLPSIKNRESYKRATISDDLILINANDNRADIIALWTIYKRDELAPGHEGGQFGIYFKKVNGEFKFAGLETIP